MQQALKSIVQRCSWFNSSLIFIKGILSTMWPI